MEARIRSWHNKVFGIELTVENEEEHEIVDRFWAGGVKVNAITNHPEGSALELTVADDPESTR